MVGPLHDHSLAIWSTQDTVDYKHSFICFSFLVLDSGALNFSTSSYWTYTHEYTYQACHWNFSARAVPARVTLLFGISRERSRVASRVSMPITRALSSRSVPYTRAPFILCISVRFSRAVTGGAHSRICAPPRAPCHAQTRNQCAPVSKSVRHSLGSTFRQKKIAHLPSYFCAKFF